MLRRTFFLVFLLAAAIPASAITNGNLVVIPAAIHGNGAHNSLWRMDLILANTRPQDATVMVFWLPRDSDNSAATPVILTLPAGQTVTYDDVVQSLLGMTSGTGAIRIISNVAVAANSRVYNLKDGVSVGQGFPGLPPEAMVIEGRSTTIPGLRENSANRANLFATAGPAGAEFTITILSPDASTLGSASFTLAPWSAFYVPVSNIVSGKPGDVRARILVTRGAAWFAGARVENASGDPFTVSAVYPPPFLATDFAGNYAGSWYNTTFRSAGAIQFSVTVDEAAGTLQVTLDVDGNVFGGSDTPRRGWRCLSLARIIPSAARSS